MSQAQPTLSFDLVRAAKKFFVSFFVVCTFLAYAIEQRFANSNDASTVTDPTSDSSTTQPVPSPTQLIITAPQNVPAQRATPVAAPKPTTVPVKSNGLYRDGAYTGAQVDAFYGWVQVKAVIKSGKISDVQFLQYPNDRRTSQRINSIATPWLTSEAVRAQSANVNIISGATLTSEAFMQSLQAALNTAKN